MLEDSELRACCNTDRRYTVGRVVGILVGFRNWVLGPDCVVVSGEPIFRGRARLSRGFEWSVESKLCRDHTLVFNHAIRLI